MTEQQLLRDPDIKPTGEVLAAALSSAYKTYIDFTEQLKNHEIELDWRYYNDGKSWLGKGLYKWSTSRGTQKESTVFWLSVWDGFFKVTFYISEKYRQNTITLPLNNETHKMIENAVQIGKLKFFPLTFDISADILFNDLFTLIDFKKTIK